VGREVDVVLTAMRRRPAWYRRYVEGPLGRKETCVARGADDAVLAPLALTDRYEQHDARLVELAAAAIDALQVRLRAGVDEEAAVTEVLCAVFGVGVGAEDLECPPHAGANDADRVSALLRDPAVVRRVIAASRAILADTAEVA
jgi:hypothetical protein